MSVCRSFNVPSKSLSPSVLPPPLQAEHTEGAAVDSAAPSVATVSFDGYEIMKVLSISVKVQSMSIAAFESYLVEELTNCVMACIADGLINGTGSSQGTGVLNGITWGRYKRPYLPQNKRAEICRRCEGRCRAETRVRFRRLLGNEQRRAVQPVFTAWWTATGDRSSLLIRRPRGSEKFLASLSLLMITSRRKLSCSVTSTTWATICRRVSRSRLPRESSFKSGRIDYRAMAVADCKPIVEEAFIKLTRSAT